MPVANNLLKPAVLPIDTAARVPDLRLTPPSAVLADGLMSLNGPGHRSPAPKASDRSWRDWTRIAKSAGIQDQATTIRNDNEIARVVTNPGGEIPGLSEGLNRAGGPAESLTGSRTCGLP
jgi:hypothetical protein